MQQNVASGSIEGKKNYSEFVALFYHVLAYVPLGPLARAGTDDALVSFFEVTRAGASSPSSSEIARAPKGLDILPNN